MMHKKTTIAVFGGVYSNYYSLEALIRDARNRGAEKIYCLGDVGGFGPNPDRVFELLREEPDIVTMQGNYDHSIGHRLDDCACGYTDPKDNYYAQLSYDYTFENTNESNKDWLRDLPTGFRFQWGSKNVQMCHGSPRQTNEFLWESLCSNRFLTYLLDEAQADVLLVTHTGIPWSRELKDGRLVINVGVIGRPPNDGTTLVDYYLIHYTKDDLSYERVRLPYNHTQLAEDMKSENLPELFIETILTGWWTTCLEILPAKERSLGKY